MAKDIQCSSVVVWPYARRIVNCSSLYSLIFRYKEDARFGMSLCSLSAIYTTLMLCRQHPWAAAVWFL